MSSAKSVAPEYQLDNMKYSVRVCLAGYASTAQLEYEENVLLDIFKETGGQPVSDEAYGRFVPYAANNWLRDANGCRMMRPAGAFSVGFHPRHTSVRLGQKPLPGLTHQKNISFMNWTLARSSFKPPVRWFDNFDKF